MAKVQASTSRDHTKEQSKVLLCNCEHTFQDETYGKGRRLHNPFKNGFRCTVCGREKLI